MATAMVAVVVVVEMAILLPRLRPDQSRILVHPAKTKVCAMARRYGKTVMAGSAALAAAYRGAKVAWVVPHYKNGRPLWRWAEAVTAPLAKRKQVETNRTERTIEFASGGFLGIYSADNDSSIRGEWFNLAILEEAAQIAEETWTEVVQPTLADADGDAIIISTPKGKNWFWREWQRGRLAMDTEYAAFTAPSHANPSPHIQRAAMLARERVPDATYRQEWLAEFVEEANDTFAREWFAERRFDAAGYVPPATTLARYLSWDTGFKDTDAAAYSACTVGELTETYQLRIRQVWREKVTFPNLVDHMRRLAREHNGDGKLRAEIIEDKASGTSAYQTLRAVRDEADTVQLVPFQPQGSKEQRASQAAVWCKHGRVWLPHPGPAARWLLPFEEELFSFPSSAYKDQVDSLSQLVLYLEHYLAEGLRAQSGAGTRAQGQGAGTGLGTRVGARAA